jgi:ribonucleoside-diphosphate reductase beta chain
MGKLQEKRVHYKPFEHNGALEFVKLINHTFWTHDELNFDEDIHHFKTMLTDSEKEVLKRSLLSISQIEVSVKSFWGKLYDYIPKPEFNGLGATFSENEFRHSEAYSRLLDELGYEDEFRRLVEIPVFNKMLNLIESEMKSEDIFDRLLFFTIVVENSSLFTKFANVLAFNRFRKGIMKNVADVISWTSIDENVHKEAGIYIINLMIQEGYVVDKERLHKNILNYVSVENELLTWIYECGELDFFTQENMLNFLKNRIDLSIEKIGCDKIFNITDEDLEPMEWFDEEIYSSASTDFHARRPVAYSNHNSSVEAEDLY